jgi:transcriptional regulator with XRE-family HTH domain
LMTDRPDIRLRPDYSGVKQNHLGDYFRARRLELGLTPGDVARRLGYQNLSKGARRSLDLEAGHRASADFLARLADLLGITPEAVRQLLERDRRAYVEAWERWASEPVPPQVVVRLLPGVFGTTLLPEGVTTPDDAVTFGQREARRLRKVVFVLLSRRVSVTIAESGEVTSRSVATPDQDVTPVMRLGGKPFRLRLGGVGDPGVLPAD